MVAHVNTLPTRRSSQLIKIFGTSSLDEVTLDDVTHPKPGGSRVSAYCELPLARSCSTMLRKIRSATGHPRTHGRGKCRHQPDPSLL